MRVVIMVMLIMLLILSGTNNDIDGTDNIISAKEGTQVSVVAVLIMMLDTVMITSIDLTKAKKENTSDSSNTDSNHL